MKLVFADTLYWVALINPADQWNGPALEASRLLGDSRIVTTPDVLVEVLNYYAEWSEHIKHAAALNVRATLGSRHAEVVMRSDELFFAGLALYEGRLDRGYSLTELHLDECHARA